MFVVAMCKIGTKATLPTFVPDIAVAGCKLGRMYATNMAIAGVGGNILAGVEAFEFPQLLTLFNTHNGLGGAPTSRTETQKATPLAPISGVTILSSAANQLGIGTLTVKLSSASAKLSWQGHGAPKAVSRLIGGDATVELLHEGGSINGSLLLEVDYAKLKEGSYLISIDMIMGTLIPKITEAMISYGSTTYVGYVVKNISTEINFTVVTAEVLTQIGEGIETTIGTSALSTTISSTTEAPAGVTFQRAIQLPAMPAGSEIALWIRLVVSAGTPSKRDIASSRLAIEGRI